MPACIEQYNDISVALGADVSGLSNRLATEKAIQIVIQMYQSMNIPLNIKRIRRFTGFLPKLVEVSMRNGIVLINPRLKRAEDIQLII
ncbi:hypothetical protein V7122_01000 [Bacillus sp. JJ1532]|uniref:hypothetical protein n=1 Tax=Bacillus sp. JJ1532 TaxID=3122958 RepID=UPI002FFF57DF